MIDLRKIKFCQKLVTIYEEEEDDCEEELLLILLRIKEAQHDYCVKYGLR